MAPIDSSSSALLRVESLTVRFSTPDGEIHAVNNINFEIGAGESLGVVGESGCGKTQTFLGLLGLLADNGSVNGHAWFKPTSEQTETDLLAISPRALRAVRGEKISMIFQDPMTSLNPYLKIGSQLSEVLRIHLGLDKKEIKRRVLQMLEAVKMPAASQRFNMYPHELSGGMRQRAMIAMALLCQPDLIIADEPTTALDVTIQAQIIALLKELKKEFGVAVVLITHDLGVVANLCQRALVMYAGEIVEQADVITLFEQPQHPYTQGLLRALPRLDDSSARLLPIPGQPPSLVQPPHACAFAPRCCYRFARCDREHPDLRLQQVANNSLRGHLKACHLESLS